ncbi:MAG: hypothetical protein M3R06_01670, partial [Chloroflexota bacterium]|nr:hypothetical protein [Chloroflexota bacterium]
MRAKAVSRDKQHGMTENRRRSLSSLSSFMVCVVAFTSLSTPVYGQTQDWAAPTTVYILGAGHTSDRLFLDTWRTHRVLLGDPITEEFEANTSFTGTPPTRRTVQYHENVALTFLPDQPLGEQVWALPLGKEAFDRDNVKRMPDFLASGSCASESPETCVHFETTGHTLRGIAKEFWESNGGERLIGEPLSEAMPRDGFIVQYFGQAVLRWKTGREVSPRPLGEETAKRLKLDTQRVPQPDSVPIYSEILFVPPPAPIEV